MSIYLQAFRPLWQWKRKRANAERLGESPFVDASIRREPDFKHEMPGISSLCRDGLFSNYLKKEDKVIYITTALHDETLGKHWRIIAILQVIKECSNHNEAAKWYNDNGHLSLPINCMALGNENIENVALHEVSHYEMNPQFPNDVERGLKYQNSIYHKRAIKNPKYLICEKEWCGIPTNPPYVEPPILSSKKAIEILDKEPIIQRSKIITVDQYKGLKGIIDSWKG
jgi:hypothetical protein